MNKTVVNEISPYYDAQSKKHQNTIEASFGIFLYFIDFYLLHQISEVESASPLRSGSYTWYGIV
jgi:hypothetical protein